MPKRCKFKYKKAFTKAEAHRQINKMYADPRYWVGNLDIYKCPAGHYHLGHKHKKRLI